MSQILLCKLKGGLALDAFAASRGISPQVGALPYIFWDLSRPARQQKDREHQHEDHHHDRQEDAQPIWPAPWAKLNKEN